MIYNKWTPCFYSAHYVWPRKLVSYSVVMVTISSDEEEEEEDPFPSLLNNLAHHDPGNHGNAETAKNYQSRRHRMEDPVRSTYYLSSVKLKNNAIKDNSLIPIYRIRPNYRPCPHNRPPPPPRLFTIFSLIIAHLIIFFLTFYFIFTYYRPLDDLLALVVENKFR